MGGLPPPPPVPLWHRLTFLSDVSPPLFVHIPKSRIITICTVISCYVFLFTYAYNQIKNQVNKQINIYAVKQFISIMYASRIHYIVCYIVQSPPEMANCIKVVRNHSCKVKITCAQSTHLVLQGYAPRRISANIWTEVFIFSQFLDTFSVVRIGSSTSVSVITQVKTFLLSCLNPWSVKKTWPELFVGFVMTRLISIWNRCRPRLGVGSRNLSLKYKQSTRLLLSVYVTHKYAELTNRYLIPFYLSYAIPQLARMACLLSRLVTPNLGGCPLSTTGRCKKDWPLSEIHLKQGIKFKVTSLWLNGHTFYLFLTNYYAYRPPIKSIKSALQPLGRGKPQAQGQRGLYQKNHYGSYT